MKSDLRNQIMRAVITILVLGLQSVGAAGARQPVSLLVMLDASASMQQNDASGLRRAATQALVGLLDRDDEVAIAEFDGVTRTLSGQGKEAWIKASDGPRLLQAISQASDQGQFTDFRAALQGALDLLQDVPKSRRKVLLLLTDGILEPNPRDDAYAPYNYGYLAAMARHFGDPHQQIYRTEFLPKLAPVASRLIETEIVPALKQAGVEVFTIALGPAADRSFLDALAAQTSLQPTEAHSFAATAATDLIPVFTQAIGYFTDLLVFRSVDGEIVPGQMTSLPIDGFISGPRIISLVDGNGELAVRGADGREETAELGLHPSLRVFRLVGAEPPATWSFGFESGQGRHRTLIVGHNRLMIRTEGLKRQYTFEEPVRLAASVRVAGTGEPAALGAKSRLVADIHPADGAGEEVQLDLAHSGNVFETVWKPGRPGEYRVRLTAYLFDANGRPVMPRPGLVFQIQVLPAFYVEPVKLDFGDVRAGRHKRLTITIHYGLAHPSRIRIASSLTAGTSKAFRQQDWKHLPAIAPEELSMSPGAVVAHSVALSVPDGGAWGDYSGRIRLTVDGGETRTVAYRVHVPSILEKLRVWVLVILAMLVALLAYLIYVWGFLCGPRGVLVPMGGAGIQVPYKLGNVHRPWFTRYFNWKRNILSIHELRLPDVPAGLCAEFRFYQFGSYICNTGKKENTESFSVAGLRHGPGRSWRLKNSNIIKVGGRDYQFKEKA